MAALCMTQGQGTMIEVTLFVSFICQFIFITFLLLGHLNSGSPVYGLHDGCKAIAQVIWRVRSDLWWLL